MLGVVWYVEGLAFDVDLFCQGKSFEPNLIWHLGEKTRGEGVFDTSGFNLSIDYSDNWDDILEDIRLFFKDEQTLIEELNTYDVKQKFDIGIGCIEFTTSIIIPSDIITNMSHFGIGMEISVYRMYED